MNRAVDVMVIISRRS